MNDVRRAGQHPPLAWMGPRPRWVGWSSHMSRGPVRDVICGFLWTRVDPLDEGPYTATDKLLSHLDAAGYVIVHQRWYHRVLKRAGPRSTGRVNGSAQR